MGQELLQDLRGREGGRGGVPQGLLPGTHQVRGVQEHLQVAGRRPDEGETQVSEQ